MSSPAARAGRVVCGLAVAAIALVPIVEAWALMPWVFRAMLAALAVTAALRPPAAVIALVVTLPLAVPIQALSQSELSGVGTGEALVLAFVAGGVLGWVFQPAESSRLQLSRPAAALAAVIVISAVLEVRLWERQYPVRDITGEILQTYTGPDMFRTATDFPELRLAFRWLEGLIAALLVERALRRRPDLQALTVRLWIAGGAGAAATAAVRLVEVSLRQPDFFRTAVHFLETQRVTTLVPDFNAAGLYFVLFLVPALVIGVLQRRWVLLGVAAPLLALALFMTQSLAALLSLVLVTGVLAGGWLWRRGRRRLVAAAVIAGVALLGVGWAATRGTHATVTDAVRVRAAMSGVALRMAARNPVFGVGIGKFAASSRFFISPELKQLFPPAATGENAHNNWLQVLAELGLPGLVAFCALWVAATRPGKAGGYPVERVGVVAGLAAFGVSALLGHPLLIGDVIWAFYVALGLAAGLSRRA